MFGATLFVTVPNWKEHENPSTMFKQAIVHPYYRILLRNVKEWLIDTYHNLCGSQMFIPIVKFPFFQIIHLFIFYLYTICFYCIPFLKFSVIELENGLVVVKGNGRGGGERKMGVTIKRQLEASSWWWMYSVPWLYHYQWPSCDIIR